MYKIIETNAAEQLEPLHIRDVENVRYVWYITSTGNPMLLVRRNFTYGFLSIVTMFSDESLTRDSKLSFVEESDEESDTHATAKQCAIAAAMHGQGGNLRPIFGSDDLHEMFDHWATCIREKRLGGLLHNV